MISLYTTKLHRIVFTALMVFCMVYCMTIYAIARKLGGLSGPEFLLAIREMWAEYLLVFLLIFCCITHLAQKSACRSSSSALWSGCSFERCSGGSLPRASKKCPRLA